MKAQTITLWLLAGVAVIALTAVTSTQVLDTSWTRTFGGRGFDHCYAMLLADGGGYLMGGWTNSSGAGEEDLALTKTDEQGKLIWQHTYGGAKDDYGQCMTKTTDGGCVIIGYTQSFGAGDYDMYVVKTDAKGKLQWQKTYGGPAYDVGNSVQQTPDGGYILLGNTRSFGQNCQMYLVKTKADGTVEWERAIGGKEDDYGQCVRLTKEGGFILGGDSNSDTKNLYDFDLVMIKADARGNVEWQRTFGGEASDGCTCVRQTADGGYILGGDTESLGNGGFDMYLVKTDGRGYLQWWKTFGGAGWDDCRCVCPTMDGGYTLAGYSDSYGEGDQEALIVKVNAKGEKEWQKTFGGSDDDYAYAVQQADENHFVVAGYTESYGRGHDDMWLVKLYQWRDFPLSKSLADPKMQVRFPWGFLSMTVGVK